MAEPVRDVASYVREGELMGLKDEALTNYALQCVEKQQRYQERLANKEEADRIAREKEADRQFEFQREEANRIAREKEADRIAREKEADRIAREKEAERQFEFQREEANRIAREKEADRIAREKEAERQFELEKLRLELELKKETYSGSGSQEKSERPFKGYTPKLLTFQEDRDDIDAYLSRFEIHANTFSWPTEVWPLYLASNLQGKALSVYHTLCAQGTVQYEDLKRELLLKFQYTEEGYRERFRMVRPQAEETMTAFLTRLASLADRWISLASIPKDYEHLRDLLLREQFYQSVSKDLAVFLRERNLKTVISVAEHAEYFREAHPHKSLARRAENSMFANVGYSTPPSSPPTKARQDRRSYNSNYSSGRRSSSGYRSQRGSPPYSPPPRATQRELPSSPNRPEGKTAGHPDRWTPPRRCFNCFGYGHIARECHENRPRNNINDGSGENNKPFPANAAIMCSASNEEQLGQLHLYPGKVKGQYVRVLRDSGATIAGVRESLVHPDDYIHKQQSCITFGGKIEVFPLARVPVETPFYTGILTCCVIKDPVADLIIGNVRGARHVTFNLPDGGLAPAGAVTTRAQSKLHDRQLQPLNIPPVQWNLTKTEIIELQRKDPSLATARTMADQQLTSRDGFESFGYKKGILHRIYKQENEQVHQIVVPEGLRLTVMRLSHDNPLSGHMGSRTTLRRIRNQFWWPKVRRDTQEYCRTCDICQRTSAPGRVPPVPMVKVPTIEEPFYRVAVDLVGPLHPPSEEGHTHVLTLIDLATRYPEAIPLKKIDTITVAETLLTIFSRVGFPQEILTDRGSQFTSQLMEEIMQTLSIRTLHSTPYHAQTNGCVERFHGTLKPMLRRVIEKEPRRWHRYLPALLFACREAVHTSTGFSPFELLYGRKARGPMDLLAAKWKEEKSTTSEEKSIFQYIIDLKDILRETLQQATEQSELATRKSKTYYDKRAVQRHLRVGDEVLVLRPTKANKLLMMWKGPYIILKECHPDYILRIKNQERKYHINMLKQYHRREDSPSVSVAQTVENTPPTSPIPPSPDFNEILLPDFYPQQPSDQNIPVQQNLPPTPCISCNVAILQSPETVDIAPLPTVAHADAENAANIHINPDLPLPRQLTLQKLFSHYQHVLTAHPGLFQGAIEHEIKLTQDKVIRQRPYPVPFALQQQIEAEVDAMLKLGVIEPSISPYSSPVLLIKKKDDSIRFCVDYRSLNQITQFDAEPIPDPEAVYAKLASAKFFTKIDLAKGYWQIPVRQEDRHKTAFQTTKGLYQWTRMPFGLVTAPATFARAMRLLNLERFSTYHFFDDLLIGSDSWDDHLFHLKGVMSTLSRYQLTARPSKIYSGYHQILYLGHQIGQGVMRPDRVLVQKILDLKTPQTKKQVRSLLGLIGYYRRYIGDFSKIMAPISELVRGTSPRSIHWNTECQAALEKIQCLLSNFPILRLPDFALPFLLQTDASAVGLGAVLLQQHYDALFPVMYISRKLLDREARYSTVERECLAIVWAVLKLSRYLYGRQFVLFTDHKPLTFLTSTPYKNARIMRWALALQEFKFDIEPIKGINNRIADALSRTETDQEVP